MVYYKTRSYFKINVFSNIGYTKAKMLVKGIVNQKLLFQTCMSFFLLLNTKEDILNSIGNQTVDGNH